jgi:uncharacterized protein DUF5666
VRSLIGTSLVVGALAVAACGNHSSPSPTAPGSTPSAAAPAPGAPVSPSGATVSGTVVGVTGASTFRTLGVSLTVSVTGTSVSSKVDDAGHFVLLNVPAGHVELHFMGPGVDARLVLDDVAEHETVNVTVRVNGSTAELDENENEDPNHNAEVEGIVTAVGAGSLTVAGRTVLVNAATRIVHGGTTMALSDIHVGDRIHVHGTVSGTTITATTIEVQNGAETPGKGDDDHGEVELSGTLAGKAGTCPALTFTVSSTMVVTNGSTEFKDTSCAALANGDRVEVKGTKQSNGSVLASRVEKKK